MYKKSDTPQIIENTSPLNFALEKKLLQRKVKLKPANEYNPNNNTVQPSYSIP